MALLSNLFHDVIIQYVQVDVVAGTAFIISAAYLPGDALCDKIDIFIITMLNLKPQPTFLFSWFCVVIVAMILFLDGMNFRWH